MSHIMAQAVLAKFPNAKPTIGPAIEKGFYYDFDVENNFTENDLVEIEKNMRKIIKENYKFNKIERTIDQALDFYKEKNNQYKIELINELKEKGETKVSFYQNLDKEGNIVFEDLCSGPHLETTKQAGVFKLDKIAGAYWRGNEKNKMLQRIYGLAFETQKEMDDYLAFLEEAKKRDHRKIAKELDLIVFSELVGSGLPMYTPKGAILRNAVYNYSRELNKKIGYFEVNTPNFNRAELFRVSGHYDKYKDDMFKVVSNYSDEEMFFKPMNCPQHTQLYASRLRSYKDLPYRVADFSNLARDERPGELNGILRSRVFTQDDGHAFVTEEQIADEFKNVLGVISEALETYGMEYKVRLSLRDQNKKEKYLGSDEVWEKSEAMLKELLKNSNVDYFEGVGEAAIYGPKMDFIAKDSLGREWQLSTIQIDMNMPQRFGLKYIDKDGKEKMPIMIHRAIVGSERFIAIIIEHYAGAFPLWMSPVQAQIISVGEDFTDKCKEVAKILVEKNIRADVNVDSETVGNKIRLAENLKIPYMVVLGKKEIDEDCLSIRTRGSRDMRKMKLDEFVEMVTQKIASKDLKL